MLLVGIKFYTQYNYRGLPIVEKFINIISRSRKWSYYYAIEVLEYGGYTHKIDFRIWDSIKKSDRYKNKFICYVEGNNLSIKEIWF